ncbi:unnamed protein product [Miscanthus lutarioriparius]|uniref:Uncharacterized protein n=1 Tax=Miscanthus lutarioriparius TaxID=422564 RepID=A0A811NRV7_9POAL|nr:unnamed protein product [Miscanthus lutarioriparius]
MLHAELQEEEEEFQEADILWPDAADFQESPRLYFSQIGMDGIDDSEHQAPLKLQVRQKASSPIDIPGQKKVVGATAARGTGAQPAGSSKFSASHAGDVGAGSTVIGSHVLMPPHVIVDRRAKRDKALMMMLIVPSGRARARKMRE